MTDVFISYTRDERSRCVSIAERLRALGLDVWFDAKLASGTAFDREIEERVRSARAVLVLWSPKSVESNWVRSEATIGQQRNVLVSVQIAPCTLPVAFTNTHTEFLHDAHFADDDPAWINILVRVANLTDHANLEKFRDIDLQPARTRSKFPWALVALPVALISVGLAAWSVLPQRSQDGEQPATSASPAVDPEADELARLIVGQWALRLEDCPSRVPGQPLDMTPSTGAWFTLEQDGASLRTTSAGVTATERIVGVQNGWLRTTVTSGDFFYRLDEAGRLLLRVGQSEPTRLEPCI